MSLRASLFDIPDYGFCSKARLHVADSEASGPLTLLQNGNRFSESVQVMSAAHNCWIDSDFVLYAQKTFTVKRRKSKSCLKERRHAVGEWRLHKCDCSGVCDVLWTVLPKIRSSLRFYPLRLFGHWLRPDYWRQKESKIYLKRFAAFQPRGDAVHFNPGAVFPVCRQQSLVKSDVIRAGLFNVV